MFLSLIIPTFSLWGCSQEKQQDTSTDIVEGWTPTHYCPGSEGCMDTEGTLRVGAAAVSITPTCLSCGKTVEMMVFVREMKGTQKPITMKRMVNGIET